MSRNFGHWCEADDKNLAADSRDVVRNTLRSIFCYKRHICVQNAPGIHHLICSSDALYNTMSTQPCIPPVSLNRVPA